MKTSLRPPPNGCTPVAPWIALTDDGQTVWVSLAHVRQILFREDGPDSPSALLWTAHDLWEIADPDALLTLRRWVRARALAPDVCG